MNERSIFLAALEIADPAGRVAYLDDACGGDAAARRSVEELLAAHEKPGTFMPGPAAGQPTGQWPPAEAPGSRVGPYKLLQQLGEGGMGVVYMAEQEVPIRRMVAVKIIREGMDSKGIQARFEAERQALAMMDHPNIAKVLDTGTTVSGRPYFVMELVKGVPVTKFCDEHQLTLRERLELFVPICQAIQHAHQKGLIHRDIKPSNVLVALYDDKPVPKVIDFGVAKATTQKLTEKTLFTAFGSVVGTLEYMSPEQAKLNQLDIDTRSDVYGLGVLLYELLTGTTPLDRSRLKAAAFDEMLRIIREEEPERPSTRLSTAHTLAQIAAARRSEPAQLGRVVRGELDWIVMKALEKDRTRRYETANGLARDIQRYLADEAVEACPPTFGYRLRKAYRKNQAAVAVATAFLAVLIVAAAMSTQMALQARRAERIAIAERQRAEQEKKGAQAVREFLQNDLLRQASILEQAESLRLAGTDAAAKSDPTVTELLDRAAIQLNADKIEAKFPDLPFVQAEILSTVGTSYLALGQWQKASDLLSRSVELYKRACGANDPATLKARFYLALGQTQVIPELEAVRDAQIRVLGPHHRDTLRTQISVEVVRHRLGIGSKDDIVKQLRTIRDKARAHLGADDRETVTAAGQLATVLREAGRPREAIQELESIRETFQRLKLRADHPGVRLLECELSLAYVAVGRTSEAIDALKRWEKVVDAKDPSTWEERHLLAWKNYMDRGQPAAAIPLFENNLIAAASISRKAYTHESLYNAYLGLNRVDEALEQAQLSFNLQLQHYGPEHRSWSFGKVRTQIGRALVRQQKYAEAEPLLVSGYEQMSENMSQMPIWDQNELSEVNQAVSELYKATQNFGELSKWRLKHLAFDKQQLQGLVNALPANPQLVLRATRGLTSTLIDAGEYREAARTIEQVFARSTDERLFEPLSATLVNLYQAVNDLEKVKASSAARVGLLERKLQQAQAAAAKNPQAAHIAARTLLWAYAHAGHSAEAARLFDESMTPYKSGVWPLDKDSLYSLASFRRAVSQAGQPQRAIDATSAILAGLRKLPNPPQELIASELFELGYHLCAARKYEEAEPQLRQALEYQEANATGAWQTTRTRYWLGTALLGQKKLAEAEPLLAASFEQFLERSSQLPLWEKFSPGLAAGRLHELYTALDKPQQAAKWAAEVAKREGAAEGLSTAN